MYTPVPLVRMVTQPTLMRMDRDLVAYESRYGLSTAEVRAEVEAGLRTATSEILSWLALDDRRRANR